jgi:hypothetical protein
MKPSLLNEGLPNNFNKENMGPMFSNMFDKVMENPNLMEKLMDTNFQNKILGLQSNPMQAMQDPEIMKMMQDMMKGMKM